MYIVFEGFECSGKSTFAKIFAAGMEAKGLTVDRIHQPGHTQMGMELRPVIKGKHIEVLDQESLDYLFWADNLEMGAYLTMVEKERPGTWIVGDRITMVSNLAYGRARETPRDIALWHWNYAATKYPRLIPDLTIYFQTDLEAFKKRMVTRGEEADRFEEAEDQHATIIGAYEELFSDEKFLDGKYEVVNSLLHPNIIIAAITASVKRNFDLDWSPVPGDPNWVRIIQQFEAGVV